MNAKKEQTKSSAKDRAQERRPLCEQVRDNVELYLNELQGEAPSGLYELVLTQVERPLLETTMRHARGNISRAADYLGMNRATLRRKLQKYGIQS